VGVSLNNDIGNFSVAAPPAGFMSYDEDAPLVDRAKNGDRAAFDRLVGRHRDRLFKTILRITAHREDAEDAMQDALLRAYTRLEQFQGNARFSTWLVSIGVNEALSRLRARRKKLMSLDSSIELEDGVVFAEPQETRPDPEQMCANSELADHLGREIDTLPSSFRQVFHMRYVQELSTEEAARSLGISVTAVKSRLLRSRRYLQRHLAETWRHMSSGVREY
jgi:RNA polymerase sigma-70 factor (ECF subfamily)